MEILSRRGVNAICGFQMATLSHRGVNAICGLQPRVVLQNELSTQMYEAGGTNIYVIQFAPVKLQLYRLHLSLLALRKYA